MGSHITEFIVKSDDYFAAYTDNGKVRIGLCGFGSIDLPPDHEFYNEVASVNSEEGVEAIFDALVEKGIFKLG